MPHVGLATIVSHSSWVVIIVSYSEIEGSTSIVPANLSHLVPSQATLSPATTVSSFSPELIVPPSVKLYTSPVSWLDVGKLATVEEPLYLYTVDNLVSAFVTLVSKVVILSFKALPWVASNALPVVVVVKLFLISDLVNIFVQAPPSTLGTMNERTYISLLKNKIWFIS